MIGKNFKYLLNEAYVIMLLYKIRGLLYETPVTKCAIGFMLWLLGYHLHNVDISAYRRLQCIDIAYCNMMQMCLIYLVNYPLMALG